MSNGFDADVGRRRNHTRWARVDPARFMRAMAHNPASETNAKRDVSFLPFDGTDRRFLACVISVRYRPEVATRLWWIVEWTGADGEQHYADAQELDLALWRAAEMESRAEARQARLDQSPVPGGSA